MSNVNTIYDITGANTGRGTLVSLINLCYALYQLVEKGINRGLLRFLNSLVISERKNLETKSLKSSQINFCMLRNFAIAPKECVRRHL